MKWYKHDATANLDDKLQEVLLDYGYEGYGLYWYCLELIAFGVDSENLTFELKHDARIIARNGGSSVARIEEIMKKFLSLGLFENDDGGRITCLRLAKRADDYTSKLVKNKPLQVIENKQHLQSPTKSDNLRESPPRLDKNRLDKKEIKKRFSPPTHKEVSDYCAERKNSVHADRFIDFYASKGWMVGKSKMKDWKAALRGWENREAKGSNISGLSDTEMANAI